MLSPRQSRAARALLGWTQAALADASGVSLSIIEHHERGNHTARPANQEACRTALREAGVVFISGDLDGVAMRAD